MAAILFLELGQNYYRTSFSSHIAFDEASWNIQIQSTFMIFKQLAMAAILFFFQNEAKIFHRQLFMAITILCKSSEDIFVNE